MVSNWKIGDLELNSGGSASAPGYKIFDVNIPDHSTPSNTSPRRGQRSFLSDFKAELVKVEMTGMIIGRAEKDALAYYDLNNFDWLSNDNDIYLVERETKRWRVLGFSLNTSPLKPMSLERYSFVAVILLGSISPEGCIAESKTGNATNSLESITMMANAGNKDAPIDHIGISAAYATANPTDILVSFDDLGVDLEIAPVLLDGAILDFYPKQKLAYLVSEDTLQDGDRWQRNRAHYSGVSYSSKKLVFTVNGYLDYYYHIKHPLCDDPKLTLDASEVIGAPKLQAAADSGSWYDVDTIINGVKKYTLTKLYGLSWFNWRILCGASDSLKLNSLKLESWHSISGQPEIYVTAGASDEGATLKFTNGNLDYNLSWYDNYLS